MTVFARLKGVLFDLDGPLPDKREEFMFLARLLVGPADSDGDESFDVTVCSPESLAARASADGIVDVRHHVVVDFDSFDESALRAWFEERVQNVSGDTWETVGAKLGRLGFWEFEDYTP